MTESTTPFPPAGWYADPEGGASPRFWDGTTWAAPSAPQAAFPAATHAPTQNAELMAALETNTWHIRFIALLPLLMLPGVLIFDTSLYGTMLTDTSFASQMAPYLSPGYLLMLAGSWIAYLGSVPLAFFDHKYLTQHGIVRPFHWAFVFIGGFIYVIGRVVVVRSRTGKGVFPLWLAIAVQVALTIAIIVLSINMTNAMLEGILTSF